MIPGEQQRGPLGENAADRGREGIALSNKQVGGREDSHKAVEDTRHFHRVAPPLVPLVHLDILSC